MFLLLLLLKKKKKKKKKKKNQSYESVHCSMTLPSFHTRYSSFVLHLQVFKYVIKRGTCILTLQRKYNYNTIFVQKKVSHDDWCSSSAVLQGRTIGFSCHEQQWIHLSRRGNQRDEKMEGMILSIYLCMIYTTRCSVYI